MNTRVVHSAEAVPHGVSLTEYRSLEAMFRYYSSAGPIQRMSLIGATPRALAGCRCSVQYSDRDYLVNFLAETAVTETLSAHVRAEGKGFSLSSAMLSALGEGIERLAGVLHWFAAEGALVYETSGGLTASGLDHVGPAELPFFAPEQLNSDHWPYEAFTEESWIAWAPAERLFSGQTCLVPGQLAFLAHMHAKDEARIVGSNSGGLACGATRLDAIYSAVTEVIERDALNLAWFSGISPVRITTESIIDTGVLSGIIPDSARAVRDIEFFLYRHDVPGLFVISASRSIDAWDRYGWSVGTAAAASPRAAIVDAVTELMEAEQALHLTAVNPSWAISRSIMERQDPGPAVESHQLSDFFSGTIYYGYKRNRARLLSRFSDVESVQLTDLDPGECEEAPKTDALCRALRARGLDPLVLDIRWDGFPPRGTSLSVVKVLCPELTLTNSPGYPTLGHERYYEFGPDHGFHDHMLRFSDLNDLPNPYP